MPRRVIPYVRRHPYQAAANGVAYAAGLAYRHRGAIRGAYNRVSNYMRRPAARKAGMKRRSRSRLPAAKRARVAGRSAVSTGHTMQRRYNKMSKKKLSTRKLVLTGFQPFVRTFVGLTNFDVNVGRYLLRNAANATGPVTLPIHMVELTTFPNNVIGNVALPLTELQFTSVAADAAIVNFVRDGSDATGDALATTWQTVQGVVYPNADKLVLANTNFAFNFYGARIRDTKFQVHLVSFADDDYNIRESPNSQRAKNFLTNLAYPLTYSNLRQQPVGWKKGIRFHKTWTYNVPAMESSDLNVATGKVMEAHVNINHNKVLKYVNVNSEVNQDHQNDAAFNVRTVEKNNNPVAKDRLYVIITAFAPERVGLESGSARETPSYDMVVKQRWMLPPKN